MKLPITVRDLALEYLDLEERSTKLSREAEDLRQAWICARTALIAEMKEMKFAYVVIGDKLFHHSSGSLFISPAPPIYPGDDQ